MAIFAPDEPARDRRGGHVARCALRLRPPSTVEAQQRRLGVRHIGAGARRQHGRVGVVQLQAALVCRGLRRQQIVAGLVVDASRSRAPPSVASKGKRLGATPPDAPHQCSTSRDAVRERKSEPRTGQPRIQSEHKSLGDTPPNRGRTAAVQAATLCEKSVSRSCAPPTPTLACRARARPVRHPAQPQTRRDAVQERKSELRAAHSRVQSKGKSWAPRRRVSLRLL